MEIATYRQLHALIDRASEGDATSCEAAARDIYGILTGTPFAYSDQARMERLTALNQELSDTNNALEKALAATNDHLAAMNAKIANAETVLTEHASFIAGRGEIREAISEMITARNIIRKSCKRIIKAFPKRT